MLNTVSPTPASRPTKRRTPDDFAADIQARQAMPAVGQQQPELSRTTQISDDQVIARAQEAASRLIAGASYQDWVTVGRALVIGRAHSNGGNLFTPKTSPKDVVRILRETFSTSKFNEIRRLDSPKDPQLVVRVTINQINRAQLAAGKPRICDARAGDRCYRLEPIYDPLVDIYESVTEGFRAIRERIANGGPGWGESTAP